MAARPASFLAFSISSWSAGENAISINEDRTIYDESLAVTLFAVCLRTNEYMSRRVSSLVIYALGAATPFTSELLSA